MGDDEKNEKMAIKNSKSKSPSPSNNLNFDEKQIVDGDELVEEGVQKKRRRNSISIEDQSTTSKSTTNLEEENSITMDDQNLKTEINSEIDNTDSKSIKNQSIGESSNLTIKNVADHERRCEEEDRDREKIDQSIDQTAESIDQMIATKTADDNFKTSTAIINLDEVVDNFSTMATDGSRHSFCGSYDDEQSKDDKIAADRLVQKSKQLFLNFLY